MWPKKDLSSTAKNVPIKQESVMFFGGVFSAGDTPQIQRKSKHLQDDTTPDKARATNIPQSSKLPADIHSSSQLEH